MYLMGYLHTMVCNSWL